MVKTRYKGVALGLCMAPESICCYIGVSYKPSEPAGRGAKATQEGLVGTIGGYWALLGLIGKTWLAFPRLYWLI